MCRERLLSRAVESFVKGLKGIVVNVPHHIAVIVTE